MTKRSSTATPSPSPYRCGGPPIPSRRARSRRSNRPPRAELRSPLLPEVPSERKESHHHHARLPRVHPGGRRHRDLVSSVQHSRGQGSGARQGEGGAEDRRGQGEAAPTSQEGESGTQEDR